MGKIPAYAGALDNRIDRRGALIGGSRKKAHMVAYPLPNRIHARIAGTHAAELAHGELHHAVGFAIPARCQVRKYIEGEFGDGYLRQRHAIVQTVIDVHHSFIADGQRALVRTYPEQAVAEWIRVASGINRWRERQTLGDNGLSCGLCSFDNQQKVSCGIQDVIGQVHRVPKAVHF
ncbi:hypothetical protein D3C81_1556130 [compost metagenome]